MSEGNDEGWTFATLKIWVQAELKALRDFHGEAFKERDKAIDVALNEVKGHLHDLNNSHSLAREKEKDFFSNKQQDDFQRFVDQRFENMRNEIKPQYQVWLMAAGIFVTAAIGIAAGIWTLGVTPIKDEQHRLSAEVDSHFDKVNKNNNDIIELQRRLDLNRTDIQRLQELFVAKPVYPVYKERGAKDR